MTKIRHWLTRKKKNMQNNQLSVNPYPANTESD